MLYVSEVNKVQPLLLKAVEKFHGIAYHTIVLNIVQYPFPNSL